MKHLKNGIIHLYYYLAGRIYAALYYDKKYLTGRFFIGKYMNIDAPGWKWIYNDARTCKKNNINSDVPWPCSSRVQVVNPHNIVFDPNDLNNFQSFGIYYQAIGKITIGKGSYIGPNVGLITANHDVTDPDKHMEPKPITLGEKCWIGMNSTILSGVELGPHTTVGAGSVVTKSFPEGYCVIAGNPAKKIRDISNMEEHK